MTCFSPVVTHLQLCSDMSCFAFPRLLVDFWHLFSTTNATKTMRPTTHTTSAQSHGAEPSDKGIFFILKLTPTDSVISGPLRWRGPFPHISPPLSFNSDVLHLPTVGPTAATRPFCLINNLSVMYRAPTLIWLSARWVWRWPSPLLTLLFLPLFFHPPRADSHKRTGPSQEGACAIARSCVCVERRDAILKGLQLHLNGIIGHDRW